jgi:thymidine phosphorylase
VIDMPVGPTAKVRTDEDAAGLQRLLEQVAAAHGLQVRVVRSVGTQPVGRGIGPALEAHDVLSVLRGAAHAPVDLRMRALVLAADLLEFCGHTPPGQGASLASRLLDSGAAWAKFQSICEAQGGLREPPIAPLVEVLTAPSAGFVHAIDSRRLARVAKLLGAPADAAAGMELHVRLGDRVETGAPLFSLHAQTPGEMNYAKAYLAQHEFLTLGKGS